MGLSPDEQLVQCAPQRTGRALAMIGGMPLLFAALTLGRTWLNDVMFGDGEAVDAQLALFVVGLLCALWVVPAYWMAISMLSTITVNRAGLRRSGVPGARLFLPWATITEIAQHASVEGEPALIIKGPAGRITLSAHNHARGHEAIALVEQLAAERGLPITPPPENVRRLLEDKRAKRS